MKGKLVLLLALAVPATALSSTLTFHSVERSQTPSVTLQHDDLSPTRFDSINALFAKAINTSATEVEGWWSGRCYRAMNPNFSIGTLLVGVSLPNPSTIPIVDEGPLFPGPTGSFANYMAPVGNGYWNDPPAQFDTLKSYDLQSVKYLIQSAEFATLKTQTDGTSYFAENQKGNLRYSLRKSGGYFVLQNIILRDETYYKVKKGDVYASCYFFKKVL